jgi:hypothetical protein
MWTLTPGGSELDANPEIASRVEGRLERLGLSAEETDQQAGLPVGTVSAILRQSGRLPRGNALRRLAAALDGLLAPDEEALLRHYRRLDIPTRAAVVQLVSRAAGPEPELRSPSRSDAVAGGTASDDRNIRQRTVSAQLDIGKTLFRTGVPLPFSSRLMSMPAALPMAELGGKRTFADMP